MKRRVVQHGPSTLTISLPAYWVKKYGVVKGDEISIKDFGQSILLSTNQGISLTPAEINVIGLSAVTRGAIAAAYKRGYDEVIVRYSSAEELKKIHSVLQKTCVGFEILEESDSIIRIQKVSEPAREEFKPLFRRMFYFLLHLADESLSAARENDVVNHEKLVLRDWNINKLADFCRRIINKFGQNDYPSDIVMYHIIEQLEKIGDLYKEINNCRVMAKTALPKEILELYVAVNELLRAYEQLFFDFSLKKMHSLQENYEKIIADKYTPTKEDLPVWYRLRTIATEIYGLKGSTLTLNV